MELLFKFKIRFEDIHTLDDRVVEGYICAESIDDAIETINKIGKNQCSVYDGLKFTPEQKLLSSKFTLIYLEEKHKSLILTDKIKTSLIKE